MRDMPIASTSKSKIPVTFTLDEDMLPDIKSWRVGKNYKLCLDCEQIGMSKGDEYPMDSKNKKMTARFKVLSAEPMGKEMPKEEDMMKRMSERAKEGK